MTNNLRSRVKTSFIWSLNSRISKLFLDFIIQVILARLLVPEEFGVIAIVMVFVSFGRAVTNAGLGQALIQKERIVAVEESTVFYFNLILGVVFALLLGACAERIAEYYTSPILVKIIRVMSLWFVLNSLSIVQDVRLTRNLEFKKKFKISMISTILSSTIAISLAYIGCGIWALVSNILFSQFVTTALLWKLNDWRPTGKFSWTVLRRLLPFGFNMLLSSIFTGFRVNIFSIIIGKNYSTTQLGYYSRANQLQNLTSRTVTTSLQNVLFPMFSMLHSDITRIKNGLRDSQKFMFFIVTPLMVYFMVYAEEVVILLLTDKWLQSASYLKYLSILGIIYPLQMLNLTVLKSLNYARQYLLMTLLWDTLSILAAFITSHYSIEIMIYGQCLISVICLTINILLHGALYQYRLTEQLIDLLPQILTNVLFYILLYITKAYVSYISLNMTIFVSVFLGSIYYMLLTLFIDGNFTKKIYFELRKMGGV